MLPPCDGPPSPTQRPPIRVLLVDDSALMRRVMAEIVNAEPDLAVVGLAHDGAEALRKVAELEPDVVTLDVHMPGVDGLSVLQTLMEVSPRPVVMVSYLTSAGADATVRALMLGAVDVVAKPSGPISLDLDRVAEELVQKIRIAARARIQPTRAPGPPPPRAGQPGPGRPCERLVLIGASTGGPSALPVVVAGLPCLPGVGYVVVQHMPAWLSPWLAARLGTVASLTVREAVDGDRVESGTLLLAPGDQHLRLRPGGVVHLDRGPKVNRVRPSVDVTFLSAAEVFGPGIVAAVLTGIGEDGAAGAAAVRARGGYVIAEDESTCVVWGMPRAVVARGAASRVVPLHAVAPAIVETLARSARHAGGGAGRTFSRYWTRVR